MPNQGIDIRQTENLILLRAFIQDANGGPVSTGTTTFKIYELQVDGTVLSYDFNDGVFKSTALTNETLPGTHRLGNSGATVTGIWTAVVTNLAGWTPGNIYFVMASNANGSPVDQQREFQFGVFEAMDPFDDVAGGMSNLDAKVSTRNAVVPDNSQGSAVITRGDIAWKTGNTVIPPTLAEFVARTLLAEEYFDPANDAVVVSNMRGTDGANQVTPDNTQGAAVINRGDIAWLTGNTVVPDNTQGAAVITQGGDGPWTQSGGTSGGDWTDAEKDQMRYRLQLDGTQTAPAANAPEQFSIDVGAWQGIVLVGAPMVETPITNTRFTVYALSTAGAGGGVDPQVLRDSMTIDPSPGTFGPESIDSKLDGLESRLATSKMVNVNPPSPKSITIVRSDSYDDIQNPIFTWDVGRELTDETVMMTVRDKNGIELMAVAGYTSGTLVKVRLESADTKIEPTKDRVSDPYVSADAHTFDVELTKPGTPDSIATIAIGPFNVIRDVTQQ